MDMNLTILLITGAEGGHFGREVCSGLHLVRGRHPELDPYLWRLRQ